MDQAIDFSEMMNYAVERVPLLYADIESDDFAPQGKGGHSLLTASKRGTWSPVQRPRLFDFSRTTWQVRMAVTETP